jgi:hypothetical protein
MQQSIYPLTSAQQVRQKSQQEGLVITWTVAGRCKIGPAGRNVRTGAIRQNQYQMELPLSF